MLIWQKTPPAKMFWTIENRVKTLDLAMAVASATGVSSGSALTIPSLLMPDLALGWTVADIDEPEFIGEESIGSVRCAHVRGVDRGSSVSLWIGVADLLLRRIFTVQHFGPTEHAAILAAVPDELRASVKEAAEAVRDFDTETDTIYEPAKDVALPSDSFETPMGVPA
jgi:hypothetical protein